MPVLRKHLNSNFTTIPNTLLTDPHLSCRDKGLLVWMLSKPPDWSFSKSGISRELTLDGLASIQSSMKVLQAAGYLRIERKRDNQGKLSAAVWTVSDCPQFKNQTMDAPQLDFPSMENRPYNKKERINKKGRPMPAFEGGQQPELYFDPEHEEWRRVVI